MAAVSHKLKDMCKYLGLEEDDKSLFWIAELALLAKLPPHWKEYKDQEGHAYFHNHATGATSWTHPRDGYFLELIARERQKLKDMANMAEQQRRIRWDPDGKPDEVELSNGNTTAISTAEGSSYASFRAINKMAMGVHCFQLAFDSLEEGGYVHVGMAKENINYNSDAIPPDDYNCHGYTTIGEIYAAGRLVKSGLEKIRQGDVMIMVVDFSDRSIVWYKNDCPVGFYEGFEGTNLYPCVVLGHKGYKVSITRALSVPHPIMKWDSAGKADGITLAGHGLLAKSSGPTGYAVVRTSGFYDKHSPYFELEVVMLARDGFIMVGVGNQDVHTSQTQIPSEDFNHFGYASSGEAFSHGLRQRKELPRVQRGDKVGFRVLFEMQRIVFYLNDKPVVELADMPAYEQFYPCVTFGNAGYEVRINPTPRIPLGVPRWVVDSYAPPRFVLEKDSMLARGIKDTQCVTVISDIEFENGKGYMEVQVVALHPEAELCVGMAHPSVVDNFRVIPGAEYTHAGYLNSGELVAFGVTVEGKRPKIRVPDRVGVLIDFEEERILFFHNGHPVGSIQSHHVRGRFRPCITCVSKFQVVIDPTPTVPQSTPVWDVETLQENVELSKDSLTAGVPIDTGSARTCWATTTYVSQVLYMELEVELHGRAGYCVYGVGNKNFAGNRKVGTRPTMPFEEYYVVGYTSRGDIVISGAIQRRGEEPWSNGDSMGLRIDFETETFAAYKNGYPVVVGVCDGVGVGVSPMTTMIYGPHKMRLNPIPSVPPPPHRWDAETCHKDVELSSYDLIAKNRANHGYPTICSVNNLRHGSTYLELVVEYLPESGFLMLGVCGGPGHKCTDRVPSAEYRHWGYASTGELWAHGTREMGGREGFVTGDTFGVFVDMDAGQLTYYRNGYPVGYQSGVQGPVVADGVRICVTFGYANYCVRIDPCARIPAGTPRWDLVCKSPEIQVSHDHLTSTNTSYLNSHTSRGTSGFSSGIHYFEVRINFVKLGGYICLCLGTHDIHNNTAVYPPPKYSAFGYTTQGEMIRQGEIVADGLPRVVAGDDLGYRADFLSGLIIFYKNRHPVAEMEGLKGELYPAIIYANDKYSATIHTNAKERLEVPSFDPSCLPPEIELMDYDMVARNTTTSGYPTVRAASRYRVGSFFFEICIDKLDQGGFLLIGIGSLNMPENREYMPSEKYNSYAYSAAGEVASCAPAMRRPVLTWRSCYQLFALGEVVSAGHEHYQAGDKVGLICNLDKGVLTFYLNSRQTGEIRNLSPHMEYCPFVVFGNGMFQVTINRIPQIGKIFAMHEKQSVESKVSRADNFVHPDHEPE